MDQKKPYKLLLKLFERTNTVRTVTKTLADLCDETDDLLLKAHVRKVNDVFRNASATTALEVCLADPDVALTPAYADLSGVVGDAAAYCNLMLQTETEWQVLAVRAGWTPPLSNRA